MTALAPLARIHSPPRNAMQSGRANTGGWLLEYAPTPQALDPLMGWVGRGDTRNQVRLRFPTLEAAVAFAEARGISYEVAPPPAERPIKPKVYADNFRYGRTENWSH
ncbi:ETC complex I subunit [Roseococcus thiosulfatophilus]|uniref:ETC complex I subunit n=1 Tax=Roseococcus thiosulfatophilus TaxID=35813 RepID=UPI001A8DB15A|nr:ETC complex I subunit [Roseococcus thiosulfatophilus]